MEELLGVQIIQASAAIGRGLPETTAATCAAKLEQGPLHMIPQNAPHTPISVDGSQTAKGMQCTRAITVYLLARMSRMRAISFNCRQLPGRTMVARLRPDWVISMLTTKRVWLRDTHDQLPPDLPFRRGESAIMTRLFAVDMFPRCPKVRPKRWE